MAKLPPYTSTGEYIWHYTFRFICGLIFLFLILPVLIVLPLSFNVEPYFSFTPGMLSFDPAAYSLRWYEDILRNGMAAPDEPLSWAWFSDTWNNGQWMRAIRNSFFIGICATLLATALGTLAAIGLSRSEMPYRRLIMSILISTMIVQLVISFLPIFVTLPGMLTWVRLVQPMSLYLFPSQKTRPRVRGLSWPMYTTQIVKLAT